MRLILFDIDGTLISTGGAGSRAFTRAFSEVLAIPEALADIRLDGQTDLLILETALRNAGRSEQPDAQATERLYRRYVQCLEEELVDGVGEYQVLAGVRELLGALSGRGWTVGLATGNLEDGAWAKLRAGALNGHFLFGGFGSDARERCDLIRTAIERSRSYNHGLLPRRTFVVGDTPSDILHGRRAGAQVIAVASGRYSSEELSHFEPDLLVESLEPVQPILEYLDVAAG